MVSFGTRGIKGPLFKDDPDLLEVAEHLLDLREDQSCPSYWNDSEKAARMANQLILLDIARSLRKITESPVMRTKLRSKYVD